MHNASYRDMPVAALIAIAGAVLGAVLLALPWYTIDPAGVAWVGAGQPLDLTPDQVLKGRPDIFTQLIIEGGKPLQKGWRVESTEWALFRELGAAVAVFAAVKMIRDQAAGPFQRISFLVSAVVFGASPYPYLFMQKTPKFEAMHNVAPAVYLSFVAAALMLLALLLTSRFGVHAEVGGKDEGGTPSALPASGTGSGPSAGSVAPPFGTRPEPGRSRP